MIIGLTGGIATGKSTVSKMLANFGAGVIDADNIAHKVLNNGKPAYNKVVSWLGKEILNDKYDIDRTKLGKIVFKDKEKLNKLENITHPYIINEIKKKLRNYSKKYNHIVLDAPLLFETDLDKLVDETWVVSTSYDKQLKRLKNRDGFSKKEAEIRINSQMSLDKKEKKADLVIYNNSSLSVLKKKVKKHWQLINS